MFTCYLLYANKKIELSDHTLPGLLGMIRTCLLTISDNSAITINIVSTTMFNYNMKICLEER